MDRLKRFQNILEREEIAAYLIQTPHNLRYLTGYVEEEGFLLVKRDEVFFFTDSRYVEGASLKNEKVDVVDYGGELSKNLLKYLGAAKTLFFERSVPYNFYQRMEISLKEGGVTFLAGKELVEEMRMYKDREEISLIRKSAELNDDMFADVIKKIRPGVSELDLKNEMEYALRKRGAAMSSFDLIVASGARSSLPHGVATGKKIVYNEPILFDIGVIYEGYASDMTRMVYLGDPDPFFLEIYEIVSRAQEKGLGKAKEGVLSKDVDKEVREVIALAGYGSAFGHSTGHGVGLNVHEDPVLSYRGERRLERGMVFTIEPGIYLPGKFGVRIEDLVTLGEGGLEILSKTTKELIIL